MKFQKSLWVYGITLASSFGLMSPAFGAKTGFCEAALAKAAEKLKNLDIEKQQREIRESLETTQQTLSTTAQTLKDRASAAASQLELQLQEQIETTKPKVAAAMVQGKELAKTGRSKLETAIEQSIEKQIAVGASLASDLKNKLETSDLEWKAEAKKRIEARQAKKADQIREKFASSKKKNAFFNIFKDRVQGEYLSQMLDHYEGYVLLIGNQDSPHDPLVQKQIEDLLVKLQRNHQPFIYDADTAWSSFIQKRSGTWGMGLTGNPKKENANTYLIQNPYVRTMVFLAGQRIIHTPDSVTGLGAFIMGSDFTKPGRKNFFVLDVKGEWSNGLAEYGEGLQPDAKERKKMGEAQKDQIFPKPDYTLPVLTDMRPINAGVRYNRTTKSTVFTESAKLVTPYNINHFDQWIPFEVQLGVQKDATLIKLYKSAKQHEEVLRNIDNLDLILPDQEDKLRSAVFGSAGSTSYDSQSQEIIKVMGQNSLYVSEGGSGGIMYQTGKIMKDLGIYSVGIPIVGKNSLKTEDNIPREVHDLTLETDGYESRIDALLYKIELIGFAPGGKGTMRELAATLVRESSMEASENKLVFFPKAYYQRLFDFLQSLPLPTHLKTRLLMADSAAEAEALLKKAH